MGVTSKRSTIKPKLAKQHKGYKIACQSAKANGWSKKWLRYWIDVEAVIEYGCYFDKAAGERVVEFIETFCCHYKGKTFAGEPFLLEKWQKNDLVMPLFGWKRENGFRRFRVAYIEVPRKNGKSTLAAAIGLYMFVADKEPGSNVFTAATKLDQAKIIFNCAKKMIKKSKKLRRYIEILKKSMSIEKTDSSFEPLGADEDTLDGLDPHCNLIDELHKHKTAEVFEVLHTGTGSRDEPLTFAITTAGSNVKTICYRQHVYAEQVTAGLLPDITFFGLIYSIPKDADWRLKKNWKKANPNYGVSVKPEYMEQECARAVADPAYQNTFRRNHLNQWTEQAERWIDMEKWTACNIIVPDHELLGERCYMGLDLATTTDFCAKTKIFPPGDTRPLWSTRTTFWVPEETLPGRKRKTGLPMDAWVRDGWLKTTPGNVVDYDFIKADIKRDAEMYGLQEIGYDSWNATQIALQLKEQEGLDMVEVLQRYNLSEPCKLLLRLILTRMLDHGNNPVMNWMVSNIAIDEDCNANIKLNKAKSGECIDGPASLVTGLSRAMLFVDTPGRALMEVV